MDSGFIKIYRKLLDWEWYDDINTKTVFIHLLLTVNWEDKKWHGIEIKRGFKLTSRDSLAKELNLTPQQIRTCLTKLKSTNDITIESTKQYSIIGLTNYDKYQSQSTNDITHEQPTSNQRATTTKELKNIRIKEIEEYRDLSDENSKDVYPYFLYCFLNLGWKPGKSDSVEGLKEWMTGVLKDAGIKSASDAIQTLKEFHKYWNTRRDEKGFNNKNWKTTLINSPSLPSNKHKYASK